MTPEQRQIFQQLIDGFYDRFRGVIHASRSDKGLASTERIDLLTDGRIFDAQTALEAGLIDGILYPDEVVERAKQLAGVEEAHLVTYEYPRFYRGHLLAYGGAPQPRAYGLGDPAGGDLNLFKFDLGQSAVGSPQGRFMYLWKP